MAESKKYDIDNANVAWCPGCGNFGILNVLKDSLDELDIDPSQLVLVSGIGQAAKIPQYIKCNFFNGLHGRALPSATAIKASNPSLTVIAESGDGDMYGEGGNHFIHAIRRNPNITNIVHNNMIYGLTKGQASPTSQKGFKTPVQVTGVFLEPFNPLAVAVSLNAGFVARAYIGDMDKAKDIIKQAILHKGYALVDLLQPCKTFNKVNTYEWFKENTYYLDESHDSGNKMQAFEKAMQADKLPLGVFYQDYSRKTFEENIGVYCEDDSPLYSRKLNVQKLEELIKRYQAI